VDRIAAKGAFTGRDPLGQEFQGLLLRFGH
jgi:hypothetical protein